MSGQIQTVLYDLEVRPKTEAADAALSSLGKKASEVAGHTEIDFKVHADDASLAAFGGKLDSLKTKATAAGAAIGKELSPPIQTGAIEKLEANLRTLEEQKKKAFSVSEAAAFESEIRKTKAEMDHFNHSVEEAATKGQSAFGKLKSAIHGSGGGEGGGGGIGASLVGGAIGGGAATAAIEGFKFLSEKAHEAHIATEQVSTALAKAGLAGDAASEELHRIGESAAKIGDDFALPANEVKQLQGTIVGFSGLTGGALDHLTEISIGASKALGLSAEGVARLIAKSADPESVATLKRLGIQFDANATAAEKMAVIEKKLGPAIQAAKDANNDAAGSFEKVKNDLTETLVSLGSSLFEAIGPAIKAIKNILDTVKPVLDPVIDAISFLLKLAIEISLAPLNAAKAFISWAGSLGFVKDAIHGVTAAVEGTVKFIKDLIKTVSDAGSWLLQLVGIKKKDTEATVAAEAAERAKIAADTAAEASAQRLSQAIDEQTTAYENNIKGIKQSIDDNASKYALLKSQLTDPSIPEFQRKAIQGTLDLLRSRIKLDEAAVDADKKYHDEALGNADKEIKKDTDLLSLAKNRTEEAAKTLEVQLRLQRAKEGKAFSDKDQLAVDQKRLDIFNEQTEKLKLLSNDKYKLKAGLEIDQYQIKVLEDKQKINLKVTPVIDNAAIEGSLADFVNWQKELDKQLRDSRIAIITDEQAHEEAVLQARHADELEQFNVSRELNQKEKDIKIALDKKYQIDLLALRKKYTKDATEFEKEAAKVGSAVVTAGLEAAFQKTKQLSAAERDDKILGFDKEHEALVRSLNKGEISQREYDTRMRLLTQNRSEFEKQQANSVADVAVKAYKAMGAAALDAAGDAFATAAANLIAADMTLGPIAGPILGALAVGLIKGFKTETKSLLGFEHGGLGIMNETGKGEIFGPVQDFSDFATQLVLTTSKQVAQALGNQQAASGGRQSGRQDIGLRFSPIGIEGRSLNYIVERDNLLQKTERISTFKVS